MRRRNSGPRAEASAPVWRGDGKAETFLIDRLGVSGDGVARDAGGGAVYILHTLPGECVQAVRTASDRARCEQIDVASLDRVEPVCGLFGTCGGCTLQHLSPDAALGWKAGLVETALRRAGFAELPDIATRQSPPASRRRADLAACRTSEGVSIGLHRRGGDIVDLTECHVLAPEIMALLPALRTLLHSLNCFRRAGDVIINLLDSGPDVLLATEASPTTPDRTRVAAFAVSEGVKRISWRLAGKMTEPAETVAQLAPVEQVFGGTRTAPAPGAFLQATREGEAAIRDAVLDALPKIPGKRSRVVELYAGSGTLTFPMAERVQVEAFEGDPAAAQCLKQASGGTRVTTHQRDLNRQPVESKVLGEAIAVVLDPPYAGTGAQLSQILTGAAPVVVYVSCNPQALLRDATALHGAGYGLDSVTVIDQFLWSTEIETVCRFSKRRR